MPAELILLGFSFSPSIFRLSSTLRFGLVVSAGSSPPHPEPTAIPTTTMTAPAKRIVRLVLDFILSPVTLEGFVGLSVPFLTRIFTQLAGIGEEQGRASGMQEYDGVVWT